MSDLIDQAIDVFACELSRIDKLGCNRRLIFTMPTIDGDNYLWAWQKCICTMYSDARHESA
jgi:hypothetical protein